jgi:hypothetical protein
MRVDDGDDGGNDARTDWRHVRRSHAARLCDANQVRQNHCKRHLQTYQPKRHFIEAYLSGVKGNSTRSVPLGLVSL